MEDNGDGSWSFPPDKTSPGSTLIEGNITWGYLEQARYAWDDHAAFPTDASYVVTEDQAVDHVAQVYATRRTDLQGRVWIPVNFDSTLAEARLEELAATSVEGARTTPADFEGNAEAHEVGQLVPWLPMSWTGYDCNGVVDKWPYTNEVQIWNGEHRDRIDVPVGRARTAVVVGTGTSLSSFSPKCSGVILREQWVLTAAHCFYSDANVELFNRSVLTPWDGQVTMEEVHYIPSAFTSAGTDPKDDYALLKVNHVFEDGNEMDISAASDSVLASLTGVHNLASPNHWLVGGACADAFQYGIFSYGNPDVITNVDTLGSIYNKKVNLKMDGGPGSSGSPVFYCPGGASDQCDTNTEKGHVVAVWSGWDWIATTAMGPKASAFHAWATDIMDGQ